MANLSSTIKLSLDSSSVKRGTEDMKARFKKVGKAMAASMAIGAVAVIGMFNKFRHEMDRIGKLSKRLEETPETLQRIGLAAELAGADLETVVKGAQKFVRSVVEASEGSKIYKRAMDVLGLSAKDLLELPLEEQLIALSDAYVKSGKGGAELAAIQDLLGKQGVELIPLLREGPEELRKAMERAKPVSAAMIADMEKLNDEMTVMGQTVQFGFSKALIWINNAVKSTADFVATRIAQMIQAFKALGRFLTGDFAGAGRAMDVIGEIRTQEKGAHEEIWNPATPQQKTGSNIQSKLDRAENLYARERGSGSRDEQRLFDEIKTLIAQLKENNKNAVQY